MPSARVQPAVELRFFKRKIVRKSKRWGEVVSYRRLKDILK